MECSCTPEHQAAFPSTPECNIVVAYEDFALAERAVELCHGLARRLGHRLQFRRTLWKFDILRPEPLREMAAQDAVAAHLIVVAAHADTPLPSEVTAWIDLWLGRRSAKPGAVLALLDGLAELSRSRCHPLIQLRAAAKDAQMKFLLDSQDGVEPVARYLQGTAEIYHDELPELESLVGENEVPVHDEAHASRTVVA